MNLNKAKIIMFFDSLVYGMVIFIPFSIAIAPAFVSISMGFLFFGFFIKKILKKEKFFIRTAINIPLFLLFVMTCLSVFNTIDFRDSLKGGILRLVQFIFIFLIMVEEIKDEKQIKKIVFSMGLGLILASVDGIWQVLTGHDFIRGYNPVINLGLVRATASFKDANTLGIYLSALSPLIFGLTLYYLKGIKKIMLALLSCVLLTGIALTYSRPTLLAIYIALFFLGFAKRNKVLIIFLIILALISPFILPKSIKDWAKEVEYNPFRFMCNDDRIAMYRNSLNMIKDHPIIGVGANTYMKNYRRYKESPEYRNVVTSDYLYAHNNFLHMAAEIGLLGLVIFIWLLYKLFRESTHIYKHLNGRFFKTISLSLSACLIAFLINGLTESSLYYSRVAVIFWYMAGFALGLNKFIHADRPENN